MKEGERLSPALIAAREAEALVAQCLADGKNFLLEAGAGAGKTYSLVEVLHSLIKTQGEHLRRTGQRIACLTYTNAATIVIKKRIDANPLVLVDTIHGFCWSLIRGFQPALRKELVTIPSWQERLATAGGLGQQPISYDLGRPRITDSTVSLHHDDVLTLTVKLLSLVKFQDIWAGKFPFVLIDEYQDTNRDMMSAIKEQLFPRKAGPRIGLFGDHWQRIYDKTCGHVSHEALVEIGKKANFRSGTAIVHVLNRIRPELPQEVRDEKFVGSVVVGHSNSWKGTRRKEKGGHWTGDLPEDVAREYLKAYISKLTSEGWEFSAAKTKILILTHNLLAAEQGYVHLAKALDDTDMFIKKEDEHIAFFANTLEPACDAYSSRRYGTMLEILNESKRVFSSHEDKRRLAEVMDGLISLRLKGTVANVIDYMLETGFPHVPEAILKKQTEAREWKPQDEEEMPRHVARTRALLEVPYPEVIAVTQFIEGHTPYATKHSVKGDEFENVLVVFGRGWNHYDFNRYLEWEAAKERIPADKQETYERYRNLFYVSCSRPTTRLALLFTQELSSVALGQLKMWFGDQAVSEFVP